MYLFLADLDMILLYFESQLVKDKPGCRCTTKHTAFYVYIISSAEKVLQHGLIVRLARCSMV